MNLLKRLPSIFTDRKSILLHKQTLWLTKDLETEYYIIHVQMSTKAPGQFPGAKHTTSATS